MPQASLPGYKLVTFLFVSCAVWEDEWGHEGVLRPALCCWRSWLLDVLICNWLGIWAGMRTVKWFGCALTIGLRQVAVLRLALPVPSLAVFAHPCGLFPHHPVLHLVPTVYNSYLYALTTIC